MRTEGPIPASSATEIGIVRIDMAESPEARTVPPCRREAGIISRSTVSVVRNAACEFIGPAPIPAGVVASSQTAEADGPAREVAITVAVVRRVGVSTARVGHDVLLAEFRSKMRPRLERRPSLAGADRRLRVTCPSNIERDRTKT